MFLLEAGGEFNVVRWRVCVLPLSLQFVGEFLRRDLAFWFQVSCYEPGEAALRIFVVEVSDCLVVFPVSELGVLREFAVYSAP